MRILQICKKFPFPLKDGESIAITNLAEALYNQGVEVSLLAMNTTKHLFDTSVLPDELSFYSSINTVVIDNKIYWKDAFLNLFSDESYHIQRFISSEFKTQLITILQRETFDFIQLETLYLTPYIPTIRKYSNAKIVMRSHNVEHEIWQRITQNTSFLPKKWYLQYLTQKLANFEQQILQQCDIILPITVRDERKFRKMGYTGQSTVVPIGLSSQNYIPNYDSYNRPLSLSFIGSLDWMPNIEGLVWFLDKVWPQLSSLHPNIELHIAGRNTPQWLLDKKIPNVIIHGEVESAPDFINAHSVMIVPLLSGSGMRAKILEGMALGKTVITTSIGMEGIPATHQSNILKADTPKEFLNSITWAKQQGRDLIDIGQQAATFIFHHYDRNQLASNLLEQLGVREIAHID